MNRIELRNRRKQWQRFLRPPFDLKQEGRYSQEKTPDIIQEYSGYSGGHQVNKTQNSLKNLSGGAYKKGEKVLVFGNIIVGSNKGTDIF